MKWKQALNPPGRNTLDGFYSCFGYTDTLLIHIHYFTHPNYDPFTLGM